MRPRLRKDLLPPLPRRFVLRKELLPDVPKPPPTSVFRKELLEDVFKFLATDHKYIERHGTPGNYSYVYPPEGKEGTRAGGQEDDKGKEGGLKKPSAQEWLDALQQQGKDTPKESPSTAEAGSGGAGGGSSDPPDDPPGGGSGSEGDPPPKPGKPTKHRDDGPNLEIETKEGFRDAEEGNLSEPPGGHGNADVYLWEGSGGSSCAIRFFKPGGEADTLEKRRQSVDLAVELGEDKIAPHVYESRVEGTDHDYMMSEQGGDSYQVLKSGKMVDGQVTGRGTPEQVKAVERAIIERYKELHLKGIAHKDPNPGNQIAWGDGKDARLVDFDRSVRDPVEAAKEAENLKFIEHYIAEYHSTNTKALAELKQINKDLEEGIKSDDFEQKAQKLTSDYYAAIDALFERHKI